MTACSLRKDLSTPVEYHNLQVFYPQSPKRIDSFVDPFLSCAMLEKKMFSSIIQEVIKQLAKSSDKTWAAKIPRLKAQQLGRVVVRDWEGEGTALKKAFDGC